MTFFKPRNDNFESRATITPERAAEILSRNKDNRPLSNPHVLFLARQIEQGKFQYNGDTIKIAPNGRLLDGQHRLSAVIKSGKPITSDVAHNVPEEAFTTIDNNRKVRSPGDVLGQKGVRNCNSVAAVAKFVISTKRGGLSVAAGSGGGSNSRASGVVPDVEDIVNFVEKTKGFEEFVADGLYLYRTGNSTLSPKDFIGMHWLISRTHPREARDFFEKVAQGANLPANSPILMLRNRLLEAKLDRNKHLPALTQLAFLVKVWNAYFLGKNLKILRWTRNEPFPKWV